MASVFKNSVAQAIAGQPWYLRRKDTITLVATMVLTLANSEFVNYDSAPWWVPVLVQAVIFAAGVFVVAGTKGAITPSMAARLEVAGEAAHMERVSLSSMAAPAEADGLAVYDFPGGSSEYVGKRRSDES